jgi:hypothetical protein
VTIRKRVSAVLMSAATVGLALVAFSPAAPAQALGCADMTSTNPSGIANARTYCGTAEARVDRLVSGTHLYQGAVQKNSLATVTYHAGSRISESATLR